MKNKWRRTLALLVAAALAAGLLTGCGREERPVSTNGEHEPLTILTQGTDYRAFEALLREKYPEVRLECVSYRGSNGTGYSQYRLEHGDIEDIYTLSIFGSPDKQKEYLLDLSGYEFLNKYKTADINQVTLDGAVYMVPASLLMIGIYYNKTLFAEQGWPVPRSFEDLKALAPVIRAAGIAPLTARFDLPGNGFFDLFTMAKTDFLSTPAGRQWELDFQAGRATAEEGLASAVDGLQMMIDCGLLCAEDTTRSGKETLSRLYSREAAMYLNAGTIDRFTQNEDGTGDQYGILPFFGEEEGSDVLITMPMKYFGISKALAEPGKEQKLADALKVMEVLATQEGQRALLQKAQTSETPYVTPLKDDVIPGDSPFAEVEDLIRSGHTSTLAYAGYEALLIPVGEKVRDWVAGSCTGADVLALADEKQAEAVNDTLPPVAVAAQDFTVEQTARLEAEAFRTAAGADIGLVSLGAYHDGVENPSGVCGRLFAGDISKDVINAVSPNKHTDTLCLLTLTGAQVKELLETGFVADETGPGFPYVPAGLAVSKAPDGTIQKIVMADGAALEGAAVYTVAIDAGGFTEAVGQAGSVKETELTVVDVIADYFSTHSPLSPQEAP